MWLLLQWPQNVKENPGVFLSVLWDVTELCREISYHILLQPCFDMYIKLLHDRRNVYFILVFENVPVGRRQKVLRLSDLRRPVRLVCGTFFFSMFVCLVQVICPDRVYMSICANCTFLFCFLGTEEFNCLSLTDRISYFPLLLRPLWLPPCFSSLSVTPPHHPLLWFIVSSPCFVHRLCCFLIYFFSSVSLPLMSRSLNPLWKRN